jgi:hypothetical protein
MHSTQRRKDEHTGSDNTDSDFEEGEGQQEIGEGDEARESEEGRYVALSRQFVSLFIALRHIETSANVISDRRR